MSRPDPQPAPAQQPASDPPVRPGSFSLYRALLAKDLRRELRSADMLSSMLIYAILVLVIYGLCLAQAPSADVVQVASGLLWALVVFTSLLGLGRSMAHERESASIDGLLAAPVARGTIYLAKFTANLVFLAIVEVVSVPLFVVFALSGAELAPTAPIAIAVLAAGTVGIAAIGTLLATITSSTRGADVMLAVLTIPIAFPLLYACVSATTAVVCGTAGWAATLRVGLALAVGYDLIMLLVSWVLYDFAILE